MNYGLNDPWSTMEAFKVALDYVNKHFMCDEDKSLLQYRMMSIGLDPDAVAMIEAITFSQNCIIADKIDSAIKLPDLYGNEVRSRRFL
jgi:hypothetical protein